MSGSEFFRQAAAVTVRRGDPQGGRKVPVGTLNRTCRPFSLCGSVRQFRTIRVFRLEPEIL